MPLNNERLAFLKEVSANIESDPDAQHDARELASAVAELAAECERLTKGSSQVVRVADAVVEDLSARLAAAENYAGTLAGGIMHLQSMAGVAHDYWDKDEDHKAGKFLASLAGRAPGYRPDVDLIYAQALKPPAFQPPAAAKEGT